MKLQAVAMSLGLALVCPALAYAQAGKSDKETGSAKTAEKTAAPDKGQEKMQAMMAAYEKAATPGPEHKQLQRLAGKWNLALKSWHAPGAPPTESTGTAEGKMVLGDRFIQLSVTSDMMGKPFTGIGLTGYDNAKKKFVGTWMDSMGTGIARSEGTADADGKVMTSQMTGTDPLTGKESRMRIKETWEGDDKIVEEFYEKKGGKETKMMEITYTRAK
jgi:hypothetical protein